MSPYDDDDSRFAEYTLDENEGVSVFDTIRRLTTRMFLWYCPSCNKMHAGWLFVGGMRCPLGKDEENGQH